jgi:alkanesulfonate monooxygenase SsuD/methylene tetrahydromethanopterin reductase-like flavin-dependent oxidoreductase (luciferase family)
MDVGYAMFPQGNVLSEDENPPRPDAERMRHELALIDLVGEYGFSSFWVTEHHFGDYNLAPAPLQVLSYVAGRYPAITVGSMVVVLPWNDPLRVIEGVVMLDYLSGGRFLFGVGKGEAAREFNAFGMDLDEGRRRFEENFDLILSALSTGRLQADGQPEIDVRPAPARSFDGKIFMAAGSPFSITRAAQSGAGLLRISLRSWEEVAQQVASHREQFLAAHGSEPPAPVVLTYAYCDRDPGRAEETGMQYARAYRRTAIYHYGLGADAQGELEAFASTQLWGTPDQLVEKVAHVRELTGTDHIAFAFSYAGMPYDTAEASMRTFGELVLPRLRAA